MPIAVKPNAAGEPVDWRRIAPAQQVGPEWSIILPDDTDMVDTVLDADGVTVRKATGAERAAAAMDNKGKHAQRVFNGSDPLLLELIKDIAALRSEPVPAYMADLLRRVKQ